MKNSKWHLLQLFAGEGTGGDGGGEGAATGESTADAGQRLRELGVPEDKIRKRAGKYAARMPQSAAKTAPQIQPQQQQEQAAAAQAGTEENQAEEKGARLSWEQIMADPEYNKQMQLTMQARLRTAKGAEETLGKLTPALEVLARKHGQDPANIDYDALAKAISDDDSYYQDKAVELGTSVEAAKKLDQEQRDTARQQRQEAQNLQEQKLQQRYQQIVQQGEALKKVFPSFDLNAEMQNKTFARMLAPDMPFSVEDAYYAVHRNEIQAASSQVIAQRTAQMISNSIQAGTQRPTENGTSGQAPSVTTFDYRAASPQERAAFKQHIRDEAARGRKVYPGSYTAR